MRLLLLCVLIAAPIASGAQECRTDDGTRIQTSSRDVCSRFNGRWVRTIAQESPAADAPVSSAPASTESNARPEPAANPAVGYLFTADDLAITGCHRSPYTGLDEFRRATDNRYGTACDGREGLEGTVVLTCKGRTTTTVLLAAQLETCERLRAGVKRSFAQ